MSLGRAALLRGSFGTGGGLGLLITPASWTSKLFTEQCVITTVHSVVFEENWSPDCLKAPGWILPAGTGMHNGRKRNGE